MAFRVGSFNILNGSCRYEERMPLVQALIQTMDCDLLGVQEIHNGLNLGYLPKDGGTFFQVQEPLELYGEKTFHIDGNAVFVKRPLEVLASEGYHFQTHKRSAGRVNVTLSSRQLHFAVAHLDYAGDDLAVQQVHELLAFLQPVLSQDVIVVGDFNFTPTSPAYALIRKTFKSAFVESTGREPVITFPTGLRGPYMDPWMSGTFDYIFYRGDLSVSSAHLHGWEVTTTPDLFPSDHYALSADFSLV